MIKLDAKDIKILSILQREGRISKSSLAERVNLSSTPCWSRLQRLEKEGIISDYRANISLEKLGEYSTIFMQLELSSHKAQDFIIFENIIKDVEYVVECWAVGGGVDYMLKFIVKNIDEYQRVVDDLLNANIGILRYYSYIVTKLVKKTKDIPKHLLLKQTK